MLDSALVSIKEVNLRLARLVLGWVTVSRFNSRCGTSIAVCNQPPMSTQPGHPFMGRRGWGVKAGVVHVWVAGKMCDPLVVAHGPYERFRDTAL